MKANLEKAKDEVAVRRGRAEHAKVAPLMRFTETEDAFEMRLSLPGVEQKGLSVQVDNRTLTITAQREDSPHADLKCVRQEFPVVDYQAAYELPEDVDPAAIGAKLANGVLTVSLKKREAAKPRKIAISVA